MVRGHHNSWHAFQGHLVHTFHLNLFPSPSHAADVNHGMSIFPSPLVAFNDSDMNGGCWLHMDSLEVFLGISLGKNCESSYWLF